MHAELAAGLALCAVGRDDVAGAHARRRPARVVGQHGGDRVVVLFQFHDLAAEAQLARRHPLGETAQHRFKHILRAQAVAHRAHRRALRARPPGDPALDFLAGKNSTSLPESSYRPGIIAADLRAVPL